MDPALAQRVQDADVLLAIGGRLGDVTTRGYTLLDVPRPRQRLIHGHPDANEIGAVYEPELGIVSGPELAAALEGLEPVEPRWQVDGRRARRLRGEPRAPPAPRRRRSRRRDGDASRAASRRRDRHLGAGNFTVWAHRFYEFSVYPSQLAPRSGAMAYGVPAMAAKAVFRTVPLSASRATATS